VLSPGSRLSTNAALAWELTLSRHDGTTTRRGDHFDGFCPLAAPRFARWPAADWRAVSVKSR
jgi:hypothetical protein